jgi:L-fuculose-phosphate aldolase
MDESSLRRAMIEQARSMNTLGINQGTSGNISARFGGRMLITPSATPYEAMEPGDIAAMPLDGDGAWDGPLKPSTEWRFHRDILRGRPDAGAVVHTHAPYCTALAILRREIPAIHYMIAAFGGNSVRCAPYATFGTAALADLALRALEGRHACLLANHGMIVVGPSLDRAMWLAVELETLAKQYVLTLPIGEPALLSDDEVEDAVRSFAGYGAHSR